MMPSRSSLLLVLALLACPGLATAQGVLVDRSEIRFVTKQMGAKVDGGFRKWKANIVFLPAALAQSKAEFDIDLASVDLASADSEAEVKGKEWFDTARFSVAHFASKSIVARGGGYDIVGQLTIKGITRDCTVPITVKADPSGIRLAEGTFTVKRLDYKIGEGMWADTDTVANEVLVTVKIALPPVK